MDRPEPVLVIADGSVAGLLACAAAVDGRGPRSSQTPPSRIWCPFGLGDPRTAAVARQAELYGLTLETLPKHEVAMAEVQALVAAAAIVRGGGAGMRRIVWSANAGVGESDEHGRVEPDLDRIALIVDRALLAGRLLSIGESSPIRIETPYADLTDRQLADLVLDMDLPIWTCWWAQPDALQGAILREANAEREHWTRMLNEAGWRGPLPDLPVQVRPAASPASTTRQGA